MSEAASTGRLARKKARTRASIAAAASALFRERGFEETSIQQIAEAAEAGVGTVYNYFASKDDLLREALLLDQAYWFRQYDVTVSAEMTAVDRVLYALDLLVRYAQESRRLMLAWLAAPRGDEGTGRSPTSALVAAYVELIDEGIAEGGLTVEHVDATARLLVNEYVMAALGIGPWAARRGDPELTVELHHLTALLLGGG